MNDRYLWDRSGPPDPEVERLEKLLAPLAHRPQAGLRVVAARPARPWRALAAAAAVALAAASLWRFENLPAPSTGWQVARVDGAARVDQSEARVAMDIRAGQVMRTDGTSELLIQDDGLGRVDLGPDSEMRATGKNRLALDRGRLHAFIWARPGKFVVDTPSARAVDLGCEYNLTVDANGDGLLKVRMGWVAFQHRGRESFIPAGAQCVTRKRGGPGIPYYEDATPALADAVARFDRGDTAATAAILAAARPRDGLTLWHLLTRVPAQDRGAVFDRFAELVTVPAVATREKVMELDRFAVDECWNALNLENTDWWRGWERNWK
jgi:hypothetical protein